MSKVPKFQIGDVVRFIEEKPFIPQTGVISEVHVSGEHVAYFVKQGTGTLFVSEESLKLDASAEESAKS
jgi:transcription antitermination factor NusG